MNRRLGLALAFLGTGISAALYARANVQLWLIVLGIGGIATLLIWLREKRSFLPSFLVCYVVMASAFAIAWTSSLRSAEERMWLPVAAGWVAIAGLPLALGVSLGRRLAGGNAPASR